MAGVDRRPIIIIICGWMVGGCAEWGIDIDEEVKRITPTAPVLRVSPWAKVNTPRRGEKYSNGWRFHPPLYMFINDPAADIIY